MSVIERLPRIFAGAGGGLGQPPPDSPTLDTFEQICISSLALLKMLKHDGSNSGNCKSSISGIYGLLYDGIHFAAPISSLRADELDLVRGVLQILQGLSSSFFYWDHTGRKFCAKQGIYVSHLSLSTLHAILHQFMYAATCLQLIEIAVNEVESSKGSPPPTLRAFLFFVSAWLKRLRDTALKEEVKLQNTNSPAIPSLLGLCSSLSSLCSGAEYLLHIVHEAIPRAYFEKCSSIPAAELSAHVLDILYRKLDEVCLVKGGQEEAYQMVLQTFVGSLLPYIEGLDSWLFDGTLNDPCEEMFFYANQAISVDEAEFWEKSFFFRLAQFGKLDSEFFSANKKETTHKDVVNLSNLTKEKDRGAIDSLACPLFIKDIAKSVVSAGKSLQLIRHIHVSSVTSGRQNDSLINNFERSDGSANRGQSVEGLTLSEVFCVSVAGLVGYGDHLSRYFWQDEHGPVVHPLFQPIFVKQKMQGGNTDLPLTLTCSMKTWHSYMVDRLLLKGPESLKSVETGASEFHYSESEDLAVNTAKESPFIRSFCHENPVLTVCQTILKENKDAWRTLNISSGFDLSPLNDEVLRKTIFAGETSQFSAIDGTNFTFGFQYGESQYQRMKNDEKLLDTLFPFPTLLPAFQDNLHMSELLPQQKNSTLSSKILNWIQNFEPKNMPLPSVILQECLIVYVKKQVDHVGKYVLSKLMNDWRLMDELALLRSIYLLGSGDLLHHFLTVTFNKLDKGETWVDDFELNTILQESIRNSADGMPLSAPDSLVVSLTKDTGLDGEGQPYSKKTVRTPKLHGHGFGMDELDTLKFTYKVSWPLEIIANTEAIKKYNLVMGFLLKVKRAKFVLDKARRWMWKGRGLVTNYKKRHWLLQQKLLHFVDAFHQYVMDRVYHSAWRELCEGMMAAQSLDEVIEVHEAYLLSIQRQCFVVPDKLWALIASRINTILGLALDFYFLLQTPNSGGAVSAVKARCENEVDRIEKQFDDCIALLLRVLSFKLNVGNFPHLADLVTRINYNYFYMSQSGNLKTATTSETSSARSGKKAYGGRRD